MDKRPRQKTRSTPRKKKEGVKFKTQWDPDYSGDPGVHKFGASETIPNDHLTVRELLINHTRGHILPIKRYEAQYFGDVEVPVFDDPLDKLEWMENLKRRESDLRETIKDEIREADQKRKSQKSDSKSTSQKKGTSPSDGGESPTQVISEPQGGDLKPPNKDL